MRGESQRVASRVRDLLTDYASGPDAPAPEQRRAPARDAAWNAVRTRRGDAAEEELSALPRRVTREPSDPPRDVGAADMPRPPQIPLTQRLRSWLPVRLESQRGARLVVAAAAVIVVLIAAAWFAHRRPTPPASAPLPTGTSPMPTGSAPAPSASGGTSGEPAAAAHDPPTSGPSAPPVVIVDVAGKVRRPGVYRLPAGARVVDALHAAGGARPGVNLNGLDLAAKVVDGQQVAVGVRGAAAGVPGVVPGSGSPGAADGGRVDLNSATLEQLETLPGVGPVLGQRILDWRTQHGRFAGVAQLKEVSGIGDARFADLQPHVSV